MTYDFSQLSYLDFEELSRDLLQVRENIVLECFKPGKDQGIDFQNNTNGRLTIVQCKHYLSSGFTRLFRDLKKEFIKIEKFHPDRYILTTSVKLSKLQKDKIKNASNGLISETFDIISQCDLNNLISNNPEIEKRHSKLWLTSSAVLEKILHNASITKSEYLVERIKKKLKLYVQSSSFNKALDVINNHRMVIISGEPGVGKTTLAETLIAWYLKDGYIPVEITPTTIKEAYDIYSIDKKIIYYFDDFLGLTDLHDNNPEILTNDIVKLIDFVTNSKNARIILTSREYVLQQASQQKERIANSGILNKKYVLMLDDYTKLIKAKILYNHLYFSDLEKELIQKLVSTKTYNDIIKHPHFTPRIIEWATQTAFIKDVEKDDYPKYFIEILKNPDKLWGIPFKTHISNAARHLLLLQSSFSRSPTDKELEYAFENYYPFVCNKYGYSRCIDEFNSALCELLGSFFKLNDNRIVIQNPSIIDFLKKTIINSKGICEDIIKTAISMEQLVVLHQIYKSLSKEFPNIEELKKNILRLKKTAVEFLTNKVVFTLRLYEENPSEDLWEVIEFFVHKEELAYYPADDLIYILNFLRKLENNEPKSSSLISKMEENIEECIGEANNICDFIAIIDATDKLPRNIVNKAKESFSENYSRWGFGSEMRQLQNLSDLSELRESLETIAKKWEIDLDYELSEVDEELNKIYEREDYEADAQMENMKIEGFFENNVDSQIDCMFSKLIENT